MNIFAFPDPIPQPRVVSRDETESLFCVILFLLYVYGYVLDHNDLKINTVDVVVLGCGFFFSFFLSFFFLSFFFFSVPF